MSFSDLHCDAKYWGPHKQNGTNFSSYVHRFEYIINLKAAFYYLRNCVLLGLLLCHLCYLILWDIFYHMSHKFHYLSPSLQTLHLT